ncbi:MAG: hypothetical protein ACOC5T_08430 [Elusimicrobiota bacterium]
MKEIETYGFKQIKESGRVESYPFGEKEKYYRSLSPEALKFVLKDAKEALKAQEDIEKSGGTPANKDSGWRADDVHTILKIMRERGI